MKIRIIVNAVKGCASEDINIPNKLLDNSKELNSLLEEQILKLGKYFLSVSYDILEDSYEN